MQYHISHFTVLLYLLEEGLGSIRHSVGKGGGRMDYDCRQKWSE